jgi:hypothetical protein
MPQRLTSQHSFRKGIDLRAGTGRGIGSLKLVVLHGIEILIVSTLQNRLKHVSHYLELHQVKFIPPHLQHTARGNLKHFIIPESKEKSRVLLKKIAFAWGEAKPAYLKEGNLRKE